MKKVIVLFSGVLLSISIFGQTRVVKGKITVYNTFPVQNVEVMAKKAKTSILSDSLGQFSLVCFSNDIIKIKPKTFRPVTKKVGPDTDSLNINLMFIDTKANRELAVGYGYIKEKDLSYAVSHLEQENNNFCSYTDIYELIKGLFPGVIVSGQSIRIRATSNSFTPGASNALLVVNGIVTNSISGIPPCNVKSINILKGSDAAIYGARGGNGVVLIETKH